ncbi:MAG: archease [Nitrospirae bacterium]|nr:archease [Nitrospirota bacterium]
MKKYEPIDISGDAGLKAYGKTPEQLFINAAEGMYDLITDLNRIEEKKTIEVEVKGLSLDNLLVSWLNELIFQFDAYGFIGKEIKIIELAPTLALPPQGGGMGGGALAVTQKYTLKAAVTGEDFDPDRHESRLLIKAATYHRLRIEKINDIYEAEVIFDI